MDTAVSVSEIPDLAQVPLGSLLALDGQDALLRRIIPPARGVAVAAFNSCV